VIRQTPAHHAAEPEPAGHVTLDNPAAARLLDALRETDDDTAAGHSADQPAGMFQLFAKQEITSSGSDLAVRFTVAQRSNGAG
jgi:hypothetical protein